MSLNNLQLNGYIGNYELSYLPSGKAVGKGYIKFTVGKGQGKDEWIHELLSIVVWGDLAEQMNTFDFDKIYVLSGKLSIRRYTAKDGQERKYYELVAFSAELDVKPNEVATPVISGVKPQTRKAYGYKGNAGRSTGAGVKFELDDTQF